MNLVGEQIGKVDKIKNIATAFVFILIWVVTLQALLSLIVRIPSVIPNTSSVTLRALFFACIVAPLWEEATYRVAPIMIARTLSQQIVFPVVIISSALFGFGHGHGVHSLLFQGMMGFVFCVIYIKNNYCYLSAVTLHAMWNFFCLLFF